jgi:hypothetical protein
MVGGVTMRSHLFDGRRMKTVVLLGCAWVLFGVLIGCATTRGYDELLATFNGKPLASLIQAWGAPQASYQFPDGRYIVEYAKQQTGAIVQQHYGVVTAMPITPSCLTWFTISQQHIVESSAYEGNACVK